MLMDKLWKFVAFCCICSRISLLNAKTSPELVSILSKASDVQTLEFQTSSPQEATVNPGFLFNASQVHNASLQSERQEAPNAPPQTPDLPVGIPLSLSMDSVDDMYYGCAQKMLIKVKRHYLHRNPWEGLHTPTTKDCALRAMKVKDPYDSLSWNHFKALCAYTAGSYDGLNRAVRRQKASYRTSFQFHALHFLLSDAIRLLKLNQRSCHTAYRRSRLLFDGEPGQTMRFGSFASSSLDKHLGQFGRRTCFEIHTCFGAYLKSYTEFESDEDEVLIPPYEMFSIVSVDRSGENRLNCDVYYKLETAGVYSNLNCQAVDL